MVGLKGTHLRVNITRNWRGQNLASNLANKYQRLDSSLDFRKVITYFQYILSLAKFILTKTIRIKIFDFQVTLWRPFGIP